jgi:hypothetical protein
MWYRVSRGDGGEAAGATEYNFTQRRQEAKTQRNTKASRGDAEGAVYSTPLTRIDKT